MVVFGVTAPAPNRFSDGCSRRPVRRTQRAIKMHVFERSVVSCTTQECKLTGTLFLLALLFPHGALDTL